MRLRIIGSLSCRSVRAAATSSGSVMPRERPDGRAIVGRLAQRERGQGADRELVELEVEGQLAQLLEHLGIGQVGEVTRT